ncbi:MAG: hypothetical protein NXI20_22930 [bacterium]|nr:hypothetical protein [bacterium]
MKKQILFILAILTVVGLQAQDQNLQEFTPSILFNRGSYEFKSFQNLYTQTKSFDGSSKVETGRGRESFFTSINQFLYGINDQLNVGVDVWVKSVSLENGTFTNRTAISGVGPKIKIAPFKKLKRLSIQSTLLFPTADDQEGRAPDAESPGLFLSHDRTLWLTQFFYDKPINDQLQLFFQQAFWYSDVRDSFRDNNYWETQTSVFLSYFPNQRWTVYGMTEYFPTHYNDSEQTGEAFFSYFVQSGIGLKYQLIPGFIELESLYTNFWMGSEGNGAGQTFNFGVRIIR